MPAPPSVNNQYTPSPPLPPQIYPAAFFNKNKNSSIVFYMASKDRTRKSLEGQLSLDDDAINMPTHLKEDVLQKAISSRSVELERKSADAESVRWENSPYNWVRLAAPGRRSRVGAYLLDEWATSCGIPVSTRTEKTYTKKLAGKNTVLKVSTLWKDGNYVFQGIDETGYDIIIMMGVSPTQIHMWVLDRALALNKIPPSPSGSRWLAFDPKNPPVWLMGNGGTLVDAAIRFKDLAKQ